MSITVELFGIPRERAGLAVVEFDQAARLGELLERLGERFPGLAETCLDGPCLRAGFAANLNGERFVSDPATPLRPGDAVLILSADAGG